MQIYHEASQVAEIMQKGGRSGVIKGHYESTNGEKKG